MANGIEDLMSIRTTGGTQNVPPGPPMGGPPQPQPQPNIPNQVSMTGEPLMNSGIASMGGGQPPMGPPPGMGGQDMPVEEPVSVEQDAAMLAEATMGRTGGDPQTAIDILQTATQMIAQVGQEDPMLVKNGGPLYAQDGLPLTDAEVLKQMIMENVKDNSQTGRAISDKDVALHREVLSGQSGRTLSDRDAKTFGSILKDLQKQEVFDNLVSSRGVMPPKIR
tara:strand:- start:151 stop:816 length:666 start_codon:yes stop_codon:yes gene_type:complete